MLLGLLLTWLTPIPEMYTMDTFDYSVSLILRHEGGYVNDPRDPGGETKYGISKRAHPELDIANLTESQAKRIYRRDYWDAIKGDDLPPWLALVAFDHAVNAGRTRASRMLQAVVGGVSIDGVVGEKTLASASHTDAKHLRWFTERRLSYYTKLSGWGAFGEGWTRRTLMTYQHALALFVRDSMPVAWEQDF